MPEIHDKEERLAIENIFGKPPGWIVNWGVTLGFLFLLVCLGVAFYIRYPDKLSMQGELLVGRKPIEIVSKVSGVIEILYVTDKEFVSQNDTLVKIASTFDEGAIGAFIDFASRFQSVKSIPDYLKVDAPTGLNMGDITPLYATLEQNFLEFKNFLNDGSTFVKINALNGEIGQIERLNSSLNRQGAYFNQEISLKEKDYNRNVTLEKQGVISLADKERAESQYLIDKRNLESFQTNIISNEVKIRQIHTQIAELTADRSNGVNTRIFTINQHIRDLQSKVNEWTDKYIIKSPATGRIAFNTRLSVHDYIKASEPVMTLIPQSDDDRQVFVEGQLPLRSSGTLAAGQKAVVDIENYPSNLYGVIYGVVSDISLLPNGDTYRVQIALPNGLATSYQKEITAQPMLKTNVSIHTREYSLLERIFQNVVDVIKNKNQ